MSIWIHQHSKMKIVFDKLCSLKANEYYVKSSIFIRLLTKIMGYPGYETPLHFQQHTGIKTDICVQKNKHRWIDNSGRTLRCMRIINFIDDSTNILFSSASVLRKSFPVKSFFPLLLKPINKETKWKWCAEFDMQNIIIIIIVIIIIIRAKDIAELAFY